MKRQMKEIRVEALQALERIKTTLEATGELEPVKLEAKRSPSGAAVKRVK